MKYTAPFFGQFLLVGLIVFTGHPEQSKQPGNSGKATAVQPKQSSPKTKQSPLMGLSDQQMVEKISQDYGVSPVPRLVYSCNHDGESGYSGLADPNLWVVVLCPAHNKKPAWKRYVIAHEVGHFKSFYKGEEATEPRADTYANDYLSSIKDYAAIEEEVRGYKPDPSSDYKTGMLYAKQKLKEAGRL